MNGRTYRLSSSYEEKNTGLSYPVALLKRGIISGADNSDPESRIMFLDAINNPGFSGGPVLYWDAATKVSKVIGVVSGRIPEKLIVPKGLNPPPLFAHSGIVIVHEITAAIKAIRLHGVGEQHTR